MSEIRVLFGNLPGLLTDVITGLLEWEKGITLVGRCDDDSLFDVAVRTRPHVVIIGLEESAIPAPGETLLRRLPTVHVLGVTRGGGQSFLYEMHPHREPLGELSPEGLVRAVRAAADSERVWATSHD